MTPLEMMTELAEELVNAMLEPYVEFYCDYEFYRVLELLKETEK